MSENHNMEKVNDRYQEAVEHFLDFPQELINAFVAPNLHKYGCLFRYFNKTGDCLIILKDRDNLTHINKSYNMYPGFGEELLNDNLIPNHIRALELSQNKREILERIAYYQRKIDAHESN